jgi:hypothetical protein
MDSALRIAMQHPKILFRELSDHYDNIPQNQVLTERFQTALINLLGKIELQLDPTKVHQNPNGPPGYYSSSYNAELGHHVTPQGGYGPPRDVHASFCHDHTDTSFESLHPNVDPGAYDPPASSRRRKNRSRANSSPAIIPVIVVTDMDVAVNVKCEEPAHVSVPDESLGLRVNLQETSSTIAVEAVLEAEEANMTARTVVGVEAVPVDFAVAAARAHTPVKVEDNDDSGIVIDEVSMSDTENLDQRYSPTDFHDTYMPANHANSPDSTYGTQPIADSNTFSNANILSNFDDSDQDNSQKAVSKQSRSMLTPTKPIATRRSSRISALTTDSHYAPVSSLGKRRHKADADTMVQEPRGKRTRATRP